MWGVVLMKTWVKFSIDVNVKVLPGVAVLPLCIQKVRIVM